MKKISKVRSGDVVCVDRGLYRHHGVYDNSNITRSLYKKLVQ